MRYLVVVPLLLALWLGGCSSKVVRVEGESPCDKSFAVISETRDGAKLEYMGALEIALFSSGCKVLFSKYAIREIEAKGKVDSGVGTQYEDKDNYLDKDGNKRGGSLSKIYGSGFTFKDKYKKTPKPDADYYVYYNVDEFADFKIVEAKSERVLSVKKTHINQDSVKKYVFEALDEIGVPHLSPAYDTLSAVAGSIDRDAYFLIMPSYYEEVEQQEYASSVERVMVENGLRVKLFNQNKHEIEVKRKKAKGDNAEGSTNYPGSNFQEKEKFNSLIPDYCDYLVTTLQVAEGRERSSILFYDRKTMVLVGGLRTEATFRSVLKQLEGALKIMAEPSKKVRLPGTPGNSI
jgi:hypothetical protein